MPERTPWCAKPGRGPCWPQAPGREREKLRDLALKGPPGILAGHPLALRPAARMPCLSREELQEGHHQELLRLAALRDGGSPHSRGQQRQHTLLARRQCILRLVEAPRRQGSRLSQRGCSSTP